VKNTQIFQCPSLKTNGGNAYICYGWNIGQSTAYSNGMGYYYGDSQPWRSLGDIAMPAETILLADISYYSGNVRYLVWANGTPGYCSSVHNDGGNYAFVDGHAKWMGQKTAYGQPRLYTYQAD
jgi:prepilin-type processing-associated H-X9-DG protein